MGKLTMGNNIQFIDKSTGEILLKQHKIMKNSTVLSINSTIARFRTVRERISELESKGFTVVYRAIGSGGVGQIKGRYVQISYGVSKYNYAYCVEL